MRQARNRVGVQLRWATMNLHLIISSWQPSLPQPSCCGRCQPMVGGAAGLGGGNLLSARGHAGGGWRSAMAGGLIEQTTQWAGAVWKNPYRRPRIPLLLPRGTTGVAFPPENFQRFSKIDFFPKKFLQFFKSRPVLTAPAHQRPICGRLRACVSHDCFNQNFCDLAG
jgi:hypothetical protein